MDYERLASEIIRALRGKRSQLAFSRYLGYRSNVVRTWEARRRFPTASRFLKACIRIKIDPTVVMQRLYAVMPEWFDTVKWASPITISLLLDDLRGGTSIRDISRRSGCNRYSVSRWLSGAAEPRLPDFLRMIDATSLRLLDFVAGFVNPSHVPVIADAWHKLETARKIAIQLPWSHAVMRVLELHDYQQLRHHMDGFIANKLGISLEEEMQCLHLLAEAGQISNHRGLWVPNEVQTVDTHGKPEIGRRLLQWWAQVGVERLSANKKGLFSYNLFTVSDRDLERLKELHLAYFRQLRSIVAQSQPSEHVVVANIQLFELEE